jgi:DNA-binding transcriptional LysR family regulator
MAGGDDVRDAEYLRGLEAAVSSGVDYSLEVVSLGGAKGPHLPLPLLTQARIAARRRIPLKLVLHRYLAAKSVLNDFILEAASELPGCDPLVLRTALSAYNAVFDQLLPTVSDEYEREEASRWSTARSQHADLIQRLLRGEISDGGSLQYELHGHHLGLVVLSSDAGSFLRALSKAVDATLLMTKPSESTTWAWLGGNEPPNPASVHEWVARHWTESAPFGIGESTQSLSGWRRTHKQAQAAAGVATLTSRAPSRYRDVALVSAVSRDPLLFASLHDMYVLPLAQLGDRGEMLRTTLRAFFDADRNLSCAAALLGVSRQTVSKRIQEAEGHLGQPMSACGDLLRAALQFEECGAFPRLTNAN